MTDVVEHRIDPRDRAVGSGRVRRLLPHRTRRMVGPFVFADVIGPDHVEPGDGLDVDAHPHIGLATVTYLFDGRLVHRDSTGAVQDITPGAVNWMTAGSGVTHTERSHPDDRPTARTVHGLQTWVALPDDAQETDSSFFHAAAGEIPEVEVGASASPSGSGSAARVAVGSGWGVSSPVTGSSPLVLAEIRVDARAPVPVEVDVPERAVISLGGSVSVNGVAIESGQLVVLSPGVEAVLVGTGHAVVLGGEPVGPRHIWWNFVHADLDRIEQAKDDWRHQRFATVPDDHDPFVPLPN